MSVFFGVLMVVSVAVIIAMPLMRATGPEAEAVDERTEQLNREKTVALMAIREADFDRATGKLTEDDYSVLRGDYEKRALGAMTELDAAGRQVVVAPLAREASATAAGGVTAAFCAACGNAFGETDRFCASCGQSRPQLAAAPRQST